MNVENIINLGQELEEVRQKAEAYNKICELFDNKAMLNIVGVDHTKDVEGQISQLVDAASILLNKENVFIHEIQKENNASDWVIWESGKRKADTVITVSPFEGETLLEFIVRVLDLQ